LSLQKRQRITPAAALKTAEQEGEGVMMWWKKPARSWP